MPYSGKFTPKNPQKYKGNINNIVWRSTWELRFLKWLDSNANVLEYASEEIAIPYLSPTDGKMHRYYVDFYVKLKDKEGNINSYLVEIKPYNQTTIPRQGKKQSHKRFLTEQRRFLINMAKWNAAKKFAEDNGIKFLILTEKTLFPNMK